jgi:DNA-binding CsgD family transcriptional regulator
MVVEYASQALLTPPLANEPVPPKPRAADFPLAGPWPLEHAPMSWNEVWTQLIRAEICFRSSLWSQGKCIVVFRRSRDPSRQCALTERERKVLRQTLRGERQKLIAAEARIATSTVANCLKSAMLKLGFSSRLDAAPLATLTLSHSERGHIADARRPVFSVGQGEFIVATAPAPRWQRFPKVTNSEREICSFIIQGKSNTDIARIRATSIHTVENQVASLFRKLGASGRFDLLKVLYR